MKWIEINAKNYNPENCYYLDTNIFAIVLLSKEDEIRTDVKKYLKMLKIPFLLPRLFYENFFLYTNQ